MERSNPPTTHHYRPDGPEGFITHFVHLVRQGVLPTVRMVEDGPPRLQSQCLCRNGFQSRGRFEPHTFKTLLTCLELKQAALHIFCNGKTKTITHGSTHLGKAMMGSKCANGGPHPSANGSGSKRARHVFNTSLRGAEMALGSRLRISTS